MRAERHEQALPYGLEARKFSETIFGPGHSITVAVFYNLANTHAALGHEAEAETHYRRALAIYERYEEAYGSGPLWPIMDLEQLKFMVAISEIEARVDPEGESHFWRTSRIMGRGPSHSTPRLKVLKDYASILRKIGRDADADALGSKP